MSEIIDEMKARKHVFKTENFVLKKTMPLLDRSSFKSIKFPRRKERIDNELTMGFIGEIIFVALKTLDISKWDYFGSGRN